MSKSKNLFRAGIGTAIISMAGLGMACDPADQPGGPPADDPGMPEPQPENDPMDGLDGLDGDNDDLGF